MSCLFGSSFCWKSFACVGFWLYVKTIVYPAWPSFARPSLVNPRTPENCTGGTWCRIQGFKPELWFCLKTLIVYCSPSGKETDYFMLMVTFEWVIETNDVHAIVHHACESRALISMHRFLPVHIGEASKRHMNDQAGSPQKLSFPLNLCGEEGRRLPQTL